MCYCLLMPRTARLVIPNHPHHIIHRGHNRQPVFMSDDDYRYYLDNLLEWKTKLQCRLYAYCLMTNHVHLILDPGENEANLAKLMKRVAGRQTRYVNKLENEPGLSGKEDISRVPSAPTVICWHAADISN